jgi:two-component system response regulator HydG
MQLENVHLIINTMQVSLDNLRAEIAAAVEEHRCEERIGDLVTQAGIIPLALIEKNAILSAIRLLHGDKLKAAKLLGIGKTTLYRKLKEYTKESEARHDQLA